MSVAGVNEILAKRPTLDGADDGDDEEDEEASSGRFRRKDEASGEG